jgi:hypothetical protein
MSKIPQMSEPWARWVPILDGLVFQAYYRVLSFVSIHAPVSEVYEAARHLAETKRGGEVYWVVEGRVARWDGLDVSPPYGVTMNVWLFGAKLRGKNTVLARRGWWSLYLFDPLVKSLAATLGRGCSCSAQPP